MAGTTILALSALALSLLSFWITWVRRGRLICSTPAEVAWIRMPEAGIQLALPLVFYNTGARALVIESLELHVQPPRQSTMHWNLTREALSFAADGPRDFGHAFAVRGRDSVVRVAQFVDKSGGAALLDRDTATQAVLFARLADRRNLQPVALAALQMPTELIYEESLVTRPSENDLKPLRAVWRSPKQRLQLRWFLWRSFRKNERDRRKAQSRNPDSA